MTRDSGSAVSFKALTNMSRRAGGTAHVMKTVEAANQIVGPVAVKLLCQANFKPGVLQAVSFRVLLRCFNRALMKVVTDKMRLRIRLSHHNRGQAVATSDISDFGTGFQLLDHTGKGRQPFLDEMGLIPRSEELRDAAEKAAGLVTPPQPLTSFENFLDRRLILNI